MFSVWGFYVFGLVFGFGCLVLRVWGLRFGVWCIGFEV